MSRCPASHLLTLPTYSSTTTVNSLHLAVCGCVWRMPFPVYACVLSRASCFLPVSCFVANWRWCRHNTDRYVSTYHSHHRYIKRTHQERLALTDDSSWQAFTLGVNALEPSFCAAQSGSCSCSGYVVMGAGHTWTAPYFISGTSISCTTSALSSAVSFAADSTPSCYCLAADGTTAALAAHDGSFGRTSYLFDGQRRHPTIDSGLWFSSAGWTSEDFVEIPIVTPSNNVIYQVRCI